MTKTYVQIQKQIEELTREAEKLKRQELQGVIGRIKEAIATYDLTASDLGLSGRGRKASATGKATKTSSPTTKWAKRSAKFRDATGNSWGGRGPRPQWLRDALAAGKKLEDFAV